MLSLVRKMKKLERNISSLNDRIEYLLNDRIEYLEGNNDRFGIDLDDI